ncbi:hypothetical protein [Paenibacillus sp. 1001270B_150601_E10]|nr:hypothetical protein [Paenibacillus sp. 1001270B_150601_E10]
MNGLRSMKQQGHACSDAAKKAAAGVVGQAVEDGHMSEHMTVAR